MIYCLFIYLIGCWLFGVFAGLCCLLICCYFDCGVWFDLCCWWILMFCLLWFNDCVMNLVCLFAIMVFTDMNVYYALILMF